VDEDSLWSFSIFPEVSFEVPASRGPGATSHKARVIDGFCYIDNARIHESRLGVAHTVWGSQLGWKLGKPQVELATAVCGERKPDGFGQSSREL
jgi:hypothetical protein